MRSLVAGQKLFLFFYSKPYEKKLGITFLEWEKKAYYMIYACVCQEGGMIPLKQTKKSFMNLWSYSSPVAIEK